MMVSIVKREFHGRTSVAVRIWLCRRRKAEQMQPLTLAVPRGLLKILTAITGSINLVQMPVACIMKTLWSSSCVEGTGSAFSMLSQLPSRSMEAVPW